MGQKTLPCVKVRRMALAWTTEDPYPKVVFVTLKGRLISGDELHQLKKMLDAQVAKAGVVVVLDLSQVEHADSSGIGVLLYVNGAARAAGSELRVAGATRRIRDVLRLTHTDKVLTLDDDIDISLSHCVL